MLKPLNPSKFIERIITSQTGEQYRVVFLVTLVNGEVKAKVISAQVISAPTPKLASGYSNKGSVGKVGVFLIEGSFAKVSADTAYVFDFTPEVSPFTSLLFFTSQPTRAPSSK
ncbi:MAG: hypothetical protein PHG25_00465 [Candidatus Pacebacteria bacterium]|nr:hypothetical protein [Candidatus Paceibacterota bacterium]